MTVSALRVDRRSGRAWCDGREVVLRPKAWALLVYLVDRPGTLVTKDELLASVWHDAVVTDDTLTTTMVELRRALGDSVQAPRFIQTVPRRGFRFIALQDGANAAAADGPPQTIASDTPVGPPLPTFVGRKTELSTLNDAWRAALGGKRQVLFVRGEPGIGKSSLLETFVAGLRALPAPPLVGWGQYVEQYGGEREPYMAVLEALERMSTGPGGPRVRSGLRTHAPSWLIQMPALHQRGEVELLRRAQSDLTSHRMLREFASLMEALSADQPVVLVLEDLHWSDQATVDLISVIAQRGDRARLMIVGTYQAAHAAALDHPIRHLYSQLRARGRCADLGLDYLQECDVGAYLERRFGISGSADAVSIVHRHTNGNPLFMTTLVDHLMAKGWLRERDGGMRLTASPAEVDRVVPETLRQLIEGQVRLVPAEERAVLDAASVAGPAFETPLVAAALGVDPDSVDAICTGLARSKQWLTDLGYRRWPDGAVAARYGFVHGLYPRVLYDRIPPARRSVLHARMGGRLESGFAGRTAEVSADLAKHFGRGGEAVRAVHYTEQTAVRAHDRRAFRDAIACLESALELLRALPDADQRLRDELRLLRLLVAALSQSEGYSSDRLRDALEGTLHLATQIEDAGATFDAIAALAVMHTNRGELEAAAARAGQFSVMAAGLGASATLQSDYLTGSLALWRGDLERSGHLFAAALAAPTSLEEAARPFAVNPMVATRSFEALRRWLIGDASADDLMEEGRAMASRHRRPFTIAHADAIAAGIALLQGRVAVASALAERAIAASDEHGFPRWLGTALVIRGAARVQQSGDGQGLSDIRSGLDALDRAGLRLGNSLLLSFATAADLRLGRFEEGLASAEAGLTHCRASGERLFESELWRLRGELLRRRARASGTSRSPDLQASIASFERARALALEQGAGQFVHQTVPQY